MYLYGVERSYWSIEVSIILYTITMGKSSVSCLPQTDFGFPKESYHKISPDEDSNGLNIFFKFWQATLSKCLK